MSVSSVPDKSNISSEHVYYDVPLKDSRTGYRTRDFSEAQKAAAGEFGDGSGRITKITNSTHRFDNSEGNSVYATVKTQEELKPVKKFDTDGKKRNKEYADRQSCSHSRTKEVMVGAGCNKDYYSQCVKCGRTVG